MKTAAYETDFMLTELKAIIINVQIKHLLGLVINVCTKLSEHMLLLKRWEVSTKNLFKNHSFYTKANKEINRNYVAIAKLYNSQLPGAQQDKAVIKCKQSLTQTTTWTYCTCS